MKEIKYVPKSEVKDYKKEFIEALNNTKEILKERDGVYFSVGIVGSAKRNLVLRRGSEIYDVDIQLNTYNEEIDAGYREEIRTTLKDQLSDEWKLNNSTSVITAILPDEKSFDIALIKVKYDGERKMAKLDKNANNSNKDEWIWNPVKNSTNIFAKRKTLKGTDWVSVRDEYKKLKAIEWDKDKSIRKPSYALYVETINNVYNHKQQGK